MLKLEQKFLQLVHQHIVILGALAVLIISVQMRIGVLDASNEDVYAYFLPWYERMREFGFMPFVRSGICGYSVPYLCALWGLTKLPVEPIAAIKTLGMLFDYLQAGILAAMVAHLWHGRARHLATLAAFAGGCLLPIVFLNSSYWGQYDSVYSFFTLLAVFFAMKEKYPWAIFWIAVAGAVKLQAWFALPVFLILYVVKRKFSVLWFGLLPGVLLISGIPAWCVGMPPLYPFEVYFKQLGWYEAVNMNYPNWFTFFSGQYSLLAGAGYLLAITVLGAMLIWLVAMRQTVAGCDILGLSAWCCLACTLFLPAMHERYGYYAEIALFAYALLRPSVRMWVAVMALHGVTLVTYAGYLFGGVGYTNRWLAVVNYAAFFMLTLQLVRAIWTQSAQSVEQEPCDALL